MDDGDARTRTGPLLGVRVLELGNFIAGPFAGQLFGDYGAEVIKIEAPDGGDPMRRWGVCVDDSSLWWPIIARNKRSVVADLKNPDDLAFVQRLAGECDVVLENFRPGVLAKFGLDYDTLTVSNPGIIVTHVSGFGQTGPRATEAGFGSIGEAVGGIRHTTGDPDRPPARCGISLGDSLAAMFAVIGSLAALHERTTSGRGQEVDVAIYEAVAALMESSMVDFDVGDVLRGRSGGTLPGVAPANAYPTSDGSEVLIAGNADTVFARLCEAMDRPDLAVDDRYATHVARGENERANSTTIVGRVDLDDDIRRLARTPTRAHRAGRAGVHGSRHARATSTTPLARWSSDASLAPASTPRWSAWSRSSHARPAASPTSARHSANTPTGIADQKSSSKLTLPSTPVW